MIEKPYCRTIIIVTCGLQLMVYFKTIIVKVDKLIERLAVAFEIKNEYCDVSNSSSFCQQQMNMGMMSSSTALPKMCSHPGGR